MMSELPGQTLLWRERGQALDRLRLGFSHRHPSSRSPVGGWWQEEGDKWSLQWKGSAQPEWAPGSRAPVERLLRKLPAPFSSPLKCWKRGRLWPRRAAGPGPPGAGMRSHPDRVSPLPQVPINGF